MLLEDWILLEMEERSLGSVTRRREDSDVDEKGEQKRKHPGRGREERT